MKIINTANNKVLANIITNHRMSIEDALELVGYDLSQCDDDGAYIDDDGEQSGLRIAKKPTKIKEEAIMKYFYIERINTQDGSRNGFYIQKAANLEKVLFAFDEGESDGGLYAPHIAEITEAEFNNFPNFIPQNWVYGMEEE